MTNKGYAVIESVGVAYPKFANLSDDFTGGSLDTSKWAYFSFGTGSSASQTASEIQVSLSNSATKTNAGIWSASPYDLTGSSAQVEITALGDANIVGDKTQVGFMLQASQAEVETVTGLWFVLSEGTLFMGYFVGSAQTDVATITYDTTNHKYLRLRESSGTVYYDTSPDASTWTNQASVADPIPVLALYAVLYGQQFGSGLASTPALSNFNAGLSPVTYQPGLVTASAIVLSSTDTVADATVTVTANFDYGDSNQAIRQAVVGAVQAAVGDDTLDVGFITG